MSSKFMDRKFLLSVLGGAAMITMAARSSQKESAYFKQLSGALNKAKDMYESQQHPDDIVGQFAMVQDQVHSPMFQTLSPKEQQVIIQQFVSLGNRMMK